MNDQYGRKIDYVRLSLTDRCQLRCNYCIPKTGIKWTPCEKLLTQEEIKKIVTTFAKLGVTKLKLTGGEPLLYPKIEQLIYELKAIPGIKEVTLTTNGVKLASMLHRLEQSGLDGINISLDTLNHSRYTEITGVDCLKDVLNGLEKAATSNIKKIKVNCVLTNGLSEKELLDMASLAKATGIHVRFIEWMPIGNDKSLTTISEENAIRILSQYYGTLESCGEKLGNGPAHYFKIKDFKGKIGFISAISNHFCHSCNRVRITCDGYLKTCLFYNQGVNLKKAIQTDDLESQILTALSQKPKHHRFNQEAQNKEAKSMVQIGG